MVAFLYRMPAGIPGAISRSENHSTIEAALFNSSLPFASYGMPGKISSGLFVPFAGGDAATAFYGFLVRPYPIQDAAAQNDPLGSATPPTTGIANVLKRGYINVALTRGSAVKNGTVYVRIVYNATYPNSPVGGIEASADGTNTVALASNTYFMGPADASGNVEVAVNI